MNRKPRWSFLLVALTCFMLVGMAALARADTPLSPGRLVFTAVLPDGSQELYTGAPDGRDRRLLTAADGVSAFDPRWSPGGDRVVYVVKTAAQNTSIRLLDRGLGGGEVLGGDLRGAGSEGRAVLLEGSVRGAAPLVDRLGGNAVA